MNPVEKIIKARRAFEAGQASRTTRLLADRALLKGPFRLSAGLVLGDAWRLRGYFRRAIDAYSKGLKGSRGDDPERLEAALGLAAALRTVGRPSEAAGALKVAAGLVRRRFPDERWRVDMEGAMIARARGDFDSCLRGMRRLLKRFKKFKEPSGESFALWAIGGALRFKGDLSGGIDSFRASLAAARKAKDRAAEGYARCGLAGALRIAGKLEGCFLEYKRAARLFAGLDDDFGSAYANCGTANALRALGRFPEARAFYGKAHKLYGGLEDLVDLGYVEWGLGKTLERLGRLKEGLSWLESSHRHFKAFGEHRGVVLALIARAGLEHALGRTSKGERLFRSGYAMARRHRIHSHLEIFT